MEAPKRTLGAAVLLLASLIPPATSVAGQEASPLVGAWLGTLNTGAQELRLLFRLSVDDRGTVSGTLDSIDQGARGIPVPEATLVDGSARLVVPSVGGRFEGHLSADGNVIDGTWSQGAGSLPLSLERTDREPAPPARPQEPHEPLPYRSEAVTFSNDEADVTLAGTLTLPPGDGPFPAVVLVSGSGPQDRNETVFGHRPFLVLSDHLTRKGIAVLRYDDRGVGESTGEFAGATSSDFAGDALAGVTYLTGRSEVDPESVGIVGHSEGGLLAPIAATRSDAVRFIVLMAGPGVRGEEILYLQAERIAHATGTPPDLVARNTEVQRQLFAALREAPDDTDLRARLEAVLSGFFGSLGEGELAALGVAGNRDDFVRAQIDQLMTPWLRYFLAYDPGPTLTRVRVPVLAVNGGRDLQVPPDQNLPAIEAALRSGGNKDVTILELAGLNHLFQTSPTGAPAEYATIEETMSPAALNAVSDWILRIAGR